nr:hypothetical protein [Tanacetum cinerariifolium]
ELAGQRFHDQPGKGVDAAQAFHAPEVQHVLGHSLANGLRRELMAVVAEGHGKNQAASCPICSCVE